MSSKTRMLRLTLLLAMLVLLLGACAAGENPNIDTGEDPAGFFLGLWHGLILPITFIISLFTDTVNIYEVHNSGNWYDFGFVIGAGAFMGGGGVGAKRVRA